MVVRGELAVGCPRWSEARCPDAWQLVGSHVVPAGSAPGGAVAGPGLDPDRGLRDCLWLCDNMVSAISTTTESDATGCCSYAPSWPSSTCSFSAPPVARIPRAPRRAAATDWSRAGGAVRSCLLRPSVAVGGWALAAAEWQEGGYSPVYLANSTVHFLVGERSEDVALAAFAVANVALFISAAALCFACRSRRNSWRKPTFSSVAWMPRFVAGETGVELSEVRPGRSSSESQPGSARGAAGPGDQRMTLGSSSHSLGAASESGRFFSFIEGSQAVSAPASDCAGDFSKRMSAHMEQFHGVSFIAEEAPDIDTSGSDGSPANLNGNWECVETWGLDDFLKKMGVGRIRRLAALKAPWPTWQFCQVGDEFTYVNRSKFGVMTEVFVADGSEYTHNDLENNVTICRAYWREAVLVIERQGPQGKCKETRAITANGEMHFVFSVEAMSCSWGRRFIRKPDRRAGT